jgi:predicted nucleic acid-binding protein
MIIVDASVALKWIKEEESFRDKALDLFQKHKTGLDQIIVPNLIYIELANALVTKSNTSDELVKGALKFIFEAELKNYEVSQKTLLNTSALAKKYNTSVYDMLYAVVAKENKANLITADDKFIEKTGFKFVKHIKDI